MSGAPQSGGGLIGWLDLSSGASGDMLLGALVDAGVPLQHLQEEIGRFELPVTLDAERVTRAGLAATHVRVEVSESDPPHRTLPAVRELLGKLSPAVRATATQTFELLAAAEAAVHGIAADQVHFHEVGALDALADVAGVCAGFGALGLSTLVASPVAVGGGSVQTAHGELPVPGPAVLEILRRRRAPLAGGGNTELCTPTGAALIATHATAFGALPPMRVTATGTGAGSRDVPGRPNVLRLILGEPAGSDPTAASLVLSANVDDLDPRAWPSVLEALLAAGADDAWLTPILMKKGRPAHTVNALAPADRVAAVKAALFRETSTLGLRETPVVKSMLRREFRTVDVDGQAIAIKLGWSADGELANAMPEWEDVTRAAQVLGLPAKTVLARAQSAFEAQRSRG